MFASKSIMIVGSSMTQRAYDLKYLGFGIGLSDWYSRLADIFLRGQSGYNSRWTLATLPELIGPHKPDMAIIFLGNNDSITGGSGQTVPVEEYRSNMIAIMKQFRSVNPHIVLLLLTPTRATKVGRIDSVTQKYTDVVREIENSDENTAVVDLWDGENAISASDLCDGLHLNIEGNQKVLSSIKSMIRMRFDTFVPLYDSEKVMSDSEKNNIQIEISDDKIRLNWFFPPWNQLAGKSIEDSNELINLARLRSLL